MPFIFTLNVLLIYLVCIGVLWVLNMKYCKTKCESWSALSLSFASISTEYQFKFKAVFTIFLYNILIFSYFLLRYINVKPIRYLLDGIRTRLILSTAWSQCRAAVIHWRTSDLQCICASSSSRSTFLYYNLFKFNISIEYWFLLDKFLILLLIRFTLSR